MLKKTIVIALMLVLVLGNVALAAKIDEDKLQVDVKIAEWVELLVVQDLAFDWNPGMGFDKLEKGAEISWKTNTDIDLTVDQTVAGTKDMGDWMSYSLYLENYDEAVPIGEPISIGYGKTNRAKFVAGFTPDEKWDEVQAGTYQDVFLITVAAQ